jgi:zeaxanthin glucosyltransferase
MKLAFVSLPVSGHLNPMISLAVRVKSLGNEVSLISVPDAENRARAAGLHFIAVGVEHFPLGITREVEKAHSTKGREDGLEYAFGLMAMVTSAILRPLENLLQAGQFDGVVFDTYQAYLELAAMALNIPYVHVANAAPFDVSGDTPLCFFEWKQEPGEDARHRNLQGVDIFRRLLEPSVAVAKEYAKEKNLTIDWEDIASTRSKLAWITQMPEAFDLLPENSQGRSLYHTGPFVDARDRPSIDFAWERIGDLPLVYASMGTLQNGVERVFRDIIGVAAQLKQLQFVVALGNQLDPAGFEPLPSNVLLVVNAPQLDLLKRAVLCITHAGLNTVLESLTNGVPLVALPVTNDQPGVAIRIAAKGVGEFISPSDLSVDVLVDTVLKVLSDSRYRVNATAMKDIIAKLDGLSMAARKIHEVFSQ